MSIDQHFLNAYVWIVVGVCAFSPPALSQVETLRPTVVDNRQLPALAAADFTQVSLPLVPGSAELASQLERGGVSRELWHPALIRGTRAPEPSQGIGMSISMTTPGDPPADARPPAREPEPVPGDFLSLDRHWLVGRMHATRVAVDERTFYIALLDHRHVKETSHAAPQGHPGSTMDGDSGDLRSFMFVAAEEGTNTPLAMFATEGEPPVIHRNTSPALVAPFSGPGEFAAVPWQGEVAVIYRDRGGIFARRLATRDSPLSFDSDRWRIATAPDTISRYQLLARTGGDGAVHLLWVMETGGDNTSLRYCRLLPQGRNGCDRTIELSRSVAVSDSRHPINLMIHGDDVHVSWTDTRFAGGVWTTRNYAKLLIAASRDGGRSFGKPVTLNTPRDDADQTRYAVTLPAGNGGVLVYWTSETVQGGDWQRLSYRVGWLDAALRRAQLGNTAVSGEQLQAVLEQGFLDHHRNLGTR